MYLNPTSLDVDILDDAFIAVLRGDLDSAAWLLEDLSWPFLIDLANDLLWPFEGVLARAIWLKAQSELEVGLVSALLVVSGYQPIVGYRLQHMDERSSSPASR